MKITPFALVVLFLTSALVVPLGAAAPQLQTPTNNSTSTTTPEVTPTPAGKVVDGVEYERRIDNVTYITGWGVSNGTLSVDLYSKVPNLVSLTETNDVEGVSYVSIAKQTVPSGHYTMTVDLQNPSDYMVLLYTRQSLADGRATKIAEKPGYLIGGPWDKDDVRDGAIGGALGIIIAVLYVAVRAKIGAGQKGERVA